MTSSDFHNLLSSIKGLSPAQVRKLRQQIDRQLTSLQAIQRQVRQEAITEEIIELAAGETASRAADQDAGMRRLPRP